MQLFAIVKGNRHYTNMIEIPKNNPSPIEIIQREFPIGKEVSVRRTIRDANGTDTGERQLEHGWIVEEVRKYHTQDDRTVLGVTVTSPDKKYLKTYRPEQLQELNAIAAQEKSEQLPTTVVSMAGEVAVSAALVQVPRVAERVTILPASLEENAQNFLSQTESIYTQLLNDLRSNYQYGIEAETIRNSIGNIERYTSELVTLFKSAVDTKPYPQSYVLIDRVGEMKFQLQSLLKHQGRHSDLPGNIIEVLEKSRKEIHAM